VTGDLLEHVDEATLAFQRPQLLWIGLIALVPVAYLIYRRQQRNLTTIGWRLRVLLSATRVLILALLIAVLAGPYLKIDRRVDKKPLVAVLFDHSRSMGLPAGPFESDPETALMAEAVGYEVSDGQVTAEVRKALNQTSRLELAQAAVTQAATSLLQPLAERFDIEYFTFADALAPLTTDPAQPEFPEPEASGGATRLGDALASVLDDAAGRPIAGIILLSDGQHTGGRPPLPMAEAAAKVDAPVFPVPPGSSARLRDLAIVDVFTCGVVSVGDTAKVAVTLESQGLDGQDVEVQLLDGEETLATKSLTLRGAEQQQTELSFTPSKPGPRYLKVNVPPLADEPEELHANNSDMTVVEINEEKLKVLFIDGWPRWDFRFLKNSIRRDEGLCGRTGEDPDVVLEAEVRRRAPEEAPVLPQTVDELAEYKVVIVGDASPKLLDAAFLERLDEAVRTHGVGLIVAAGPSHMPHAFGPRLHDLLPIQMHPEAAGMLAPTHKPFDFELSPEGSVHEVMRLYEDTGRNQTIWAVMPPYYWCAAAERPAAAATVLAWNPNLEVRHGRAPLIAFHFAGEGKVLFLGLDSTWHWRQNVGERFFYKFWGQAIRFMARGKQADPDAPGGRPEASRLAVQPIRVAPEAEVEIALTARDADGAPRTAEGLSVTVDGPEGAETMTLAADGASQGRYVGQFSAKAAGDYSVSWTPGDEEEALAARFQVLEGPEELRHPNISRARLHQLATASGGELVELSDLAAIPDKLKGETKQTQMRREATIWDNWLTLLVLILVYSLDVGLRRMTGLT